MGKSVPQPIEADVATLLASVPPPIAECAEAVIGVVRRVAPSLTPKVQFGWRSVNFRHPKAGFVCGVFPLDEKVLLVLEHGRELDSPLLVDDGKVKRVRWVPFAPGDPIPEDELAILLAEAVALRA